MLQEIAKKFIATSFATSAMMPVPMGHGRISVIVRFEESSCISKGLAEAEELERPESYQVMLASEQVLKKDWDHPEEDKAWANL